MINFTYFVIKYIIKQEGFMNIDKIDINLIGDTYAYIYIEIVQKK